MHFYCVRRCFCGSALTHSFRGAFARGGFAFARGSPHEPKYEIPWGFWCSFGNPFLYHHASRKTVRSWSNSSRTNHSPRCSECSCSIAPLPSTPSHGPGKRDVHRSVLPWGLRIQKIAGVHSKNGNFRGYAWGYNGVCQLNPTWLWTWRISQHFEEGNTVMFPQLFP